jgi:hypothetical protein
MKPAAGPEGKAQKMLSFGRQPGTPVMIPSARMSFSRFSLFTLALVTAAAPHSAAAESTTYLPDGTMLVASFNVRQFLQAPLVNDNPSAKSLVGEMMKAFERVGVDASKDLDRIELGIGEQLRSSASLVLLRGRFDADRVAARMKDRAKWKGDVEILDEGGTSVYQCRLPPPAVQNPRVTLPERFFLVLLDGNTMALGIDRAAITGALARKSGRARSDLKPRVAELIGRIDPKETLSVVFVLPAGDSAGGATAGLTAITGGVTVGEGIATDVRLDTKDADSARLVADTVRDALAKVRDILPGLAALQLGLDRKGQDAIKEMVESFKISMRQNGIVITGNISKEMIEKATSR